MPTPVTVVSGLSAPATETLVGGLLLDRPGLAAVALDAAPDADGFVAVHVTTASTGGSRLERVGHCCVACTVREVARRVLDDLAPWHDAVVLRLAPAVEPDVALEALGDRVDTAVTVLPAGWTATLARARTLDELGLGAWPGDGRAASTLLAAAIETADVIATPQPDPLLGRLAPHASVLTGDLFALDPSALVGTGRFERARVDPFASMPDPTLLWRATGPLHPGRFWDRLDDLAGGIVRSRGRLWFATRPDAVLGWDTAGDALRLGPVARWLDPAPGRSAVVTDAPPSPLHRAMRHRDPVFGDRHCELGFVGDPARLAILPALLDSCLATAAELRGGADAWAALPDPFPLWALPWSAVGAVSDLA